MLTINSAGVCLVPFWVFVDLLDQAWPWCDPGSGLIHTDLLLMNSFACWRSHTGVAIPALPHFCDCGFFAVVAPSVALQRCRTAAADK